MAKIRDRTIQPWDACDAVLPTQGGVGDLGEEGPDLRQCCCCLCPSGLILLFLPWGLCDHSCWPGRPFGGPRAGRKEEEVGSHTSPGSGRGVVICYWNPKFRDSGTGSLPLRGKRDPPLSEVTVRTRGQRSGRQNGSSGPTEQEVQAERHGGRAGCCGVRSGRPGW